MDKWLLKIERVNNGYILEGKFNNSDIKTKETIEEIEENEEILSELKAMQKLLWSVQEYFAVFNSKHNKFNMEIRIIDKNQNEVKNEE